MSVWHGTAASPLLEGINGELLSVCVGVEPRYLEDLLECLAGLSFPVNPQIYHGIPTRVEFPAWQNSLREVQESLRAFGFDPASLVTCDMFAVIRM